MKRFWEIDFLRGAAVMLMVISNFVTDMDFFGLYSSAGLFWWAFARITASLFIFLAGVSLAVSCSRAIKKMSGNKLAKKCLLRGAKIFSFGMAITAVTWLFIPSAYVRFGVLHLIGLSIMLAYPFLKFRKFNLLLGIAAVISGLSLSRLTFDFPWLLWLGFIPGGFYSVDYFPLLPWFGVMLIGLFFGNMLYPKGKRRIRLPEIKSAPAGFIGFLGRNSLLIYMVHQPVLIGLIYLFAL